MNSTTLSVIQIIISCLLVAAILLQHQGSGAGAAFGGAGMAYHTKRGFEKFLFAVTIILGVLFVASAIAALFVR